jgi:hypothetical protein
MALPDMVIRIAITPSLNASRRVLLMAFGRVYVSVRQFSA